MDDSGAQHRGDLRVPQHRQQAVAIDRRGQQRQGEHKQHLQPCRGAARYESEITRESRRGADPEPALSARVENEVDQQVRGQQRRRGRGSVQDADADQRAQRE